MYSLLDFLLIFTWFLEIKLNKTNLEKNKTGFWNIKAQKGPYVVGEKHNEPKVRLMMYGFYYS